MSDSPFNFAPLGDQRDHHEHYTAGQRLNVEIGRLRQRESMLEAQIEVLELTIGKLRCVCDAAFTLVREWSTASPSTGTGRTGRRRRWQELVSALEDIGYQPVENPDA